MGKSAIPYSRLLLFFFPFFPTFGRNMKVILFFLLVIIASARVGNACSGAGADELRIELNGMREEYWQKEPTPYFEKAKRWVKRWAKRWAKNEKNPKNPRESFSCFYYGKEYGDEYGEEYGEEYGRIRLTEPKIRAKNEETNKTHVTEKKE